MPIGEKSKYTNKQKRQAAHIAAGYRGHGVPSKVAKARAWATVNKIYHGGEKPGGRLWPQRKPRPGCEKAVIVREKV